MSPVIKEWNGFVSKQEDAEMIEMCVASELSPFDSYI